MGSGISNLGVSGGSIHYPLGIGLALGSLHHLTYQKPMALVLPALTSATGPGLASSTSAIMASKESSSLI